MHVWTLGVVMALGTMGSAQKSTLIAVKPGVSKSVSGTIRGKAYVDFRVNVGAGQSISVTLVSRSTSVYFNFNPPKADVSMHIGSSDSNRLHKRIVPIEGEHIIRVYQMGAAASEGKSNAFTLQIRVEGKALKPRSASVDAKLPGTPYHASFPVDCRIALQPNRKTCEGYVIRRENGSGTVEFRYGSTVRRVLFVNGKPVAHDSPFAFTYDRVGDTTTLRFGDRPDEEFKVFDSMIVGG